MVFRFNLYRHIFTLFYATIFIFLGSIVKDTTSLSVNFLQSRAVPDSQTPPKNAVIVRQTGTGAGEFATLKRALNSLKGKSGSQFIFVYEGVYEEDLLIDYKDPLKIQGHTTHSSSYNLNTVTIKASRSAAQAGSDAQSSVLWVKKHDFAMYNINLVNSFGTGTDTQAVALTVHGDRQAYHSCSFTSFQDTLYANIGSAYFSGCNIEGAVDFIFGSAKAWFEAGTIGVKPTHNVATITANKRSSTKDPSIFIFNQVSIVPIEGALPHSAYLGRPWASYARVVYQACNISNVINPAGWIGWNEPSDPRTDHVEFGEYRNLEEVSRIKRMYGKQLPAKIEIVDVLGKDYQNWT